MDNISRRQSNEDTAISMYLSFDAESTMSTACYRTMEDLSDISALSPNVKTDLEKKNGSDADLSSTLEVLDKSELKSPLKTVKKVEIQECLPLKSLPKNILREYKAVCSTPSKNQLLKTVDVTRGSDVTECVDLGLAFIGIDDENPAYFPPPPESLHEENKENALPEPEEVSSMSTSSSVEIATSVIEKKILSSISTIGSIMEESLGEAKREVERISKDSVDKSEDVNSLINDVNNVLKFGKETNTMNLKKEIAKISEPKIEGVVEFPETQDEMTPLIKEMGSTNKGKIAVLTRNVRRSICEPNLQTNKPSRIFSSGSKRRSLLPTSKKPTVSMDAEIEIPLLMRKMLKITKMEAKENNPTKENENVNSVKNVACTDKRLPIMSLKSRTSLIPSAAGNKRPFSFTQRMSVVVKTTLNSPARKISRKSYMSTLQRNGVIPEKNNRTDNTNYKSSEILVDKVINKANFKTIASLQHTTSRVASTKRNSMYTGTTLEKGHLNTASELTRNRPDISYNCIVCKETFRIKSLLDAHKRSHEMDNINTAVIKKPSTIIQPSSGAGFVNSNQCKYCDKKFALIKALHIHLLQNCSKIPPSEKRKLQYTDLNHVQKAQLPHFFLNNNLQSSSSSSTTSLARSTNSLNEERKVSDIQKIKSSLVTSTNEKSHTSAQNVKKVTAHAGIYKTPSKLIPCHLCKKTFKSILDYTNHNLTTHSIRKTDDTSKIVDENSITTKNA